MATAFNSMRHFALIFLLLPHVIYSWRSFYIDLTGYRGEVHDNRTVQSYHGELVSYRQHNALNCSLSFARSLDAFDVELVVIVPRASFLDTHFNVTLDGCRTLDSAYSMAGNLVKILASEFRKTKGYFPDRCPIVAHRTITIENFAIDAEKFPPYVPEMDFMAQFHILSDRKYILKTFLNGSVVNKSQVKRKKARKSGNRS